MYASMVVAVDLAGMVITRLWVAVCRTYSTWKKMRRVRAMRNARPLPAPAAPALTTASARRPRPRCRRAPRPAPAPATSPMASSVLALSADPVMNTSPPSAATRTFAARVRASPVSADQTSLLSSRSSNALRDSSVGLNGGSSGHAHDRVRRALHAHPVDAEDDVVQRRVLPVHAVQELGPLPELDVERLDVLRGLLLIHAQVVHRGLDAIRLARRSRARGARARCRSGAGGRRSRGRRSRRRGRAGAAPCARG